MLIFNLDSTLEFQLKIKLNFTQYFEVLLNGKMFFTVYIARETCFFIEFSS